MELQVIMRNNKSRSKKIAVVFAIHVDKWTVKQKQNN